MDLVQWALGTLTTVTLALSAWALTKINKQDSALAAVESRTTALENAVENTAASLAEQNRLLSEVRDTMLTLNMALMGTTNSDGLLDEFKRFAERYDERSQKNEQLIRDLDKRVALVELHLQYNMPRNNGT